MVACLFCGLQIKDENEPIEVVIIELNTSGLIARVEVHNGPPHVTSCYQKSCKILLDERFVEVFISFNLCIASTVHEALTEFQDFPYFIPLLISPVDVRNTRARH